MSSSEDVNEGGNDKSVLFVRQLSGLFLNPDFSDVVFIVETQKIPAHKCILAARSLFFRALLFGTFLESSQTEIKLNVPLNAFKYVLKYIYGVDISWDKIECPTICDILALAHEYCIVEVETMLITHLIKRLSPETCITILNAADTYDVSSNKLRKAIALFIDKNATQMLSADEFNNLNQRSLFSMLRRDTFYAAEIHIFKVVLEWCQHNRKNRDDIQVVMSFVRFPVMELEELLTVVRESAVVSPERLLDFIYDKTNRKNVIYRGIAEFDKNVAFEKFGAKVVRHSGLGNHLELLSGDSTVHTDKTGTRYTSHYIPDDGGIVVALGSNYIINNLRILLWDGDDRSVSYYVEVSVNRIDWERVVDYTDQLCRTWQKLYFTPRAVRFIKLVGTRSTKGVQFYAVALEAFNLHDVPYLLNGFVSPTWNVATIKEGATVIAGHVRRHDTLNVMLNGDVDKHTHNSGFTFHVLSPGESIIVQLNQPYNIDTLSLLLWNLDEDRTYSFYIETSSNKTNWEMAVDKRNERLQSWQEFSFECRVVVFIKIVGTYNSNPNNHEFHLVHLVGSFGSLQETPK